MLVVWTRQTVAVLTPGQVAELYDVLNPWGPSDDFYLQLVLAADAVLDVGCGTGTLLAAARSAGHPGRLVGLDPDPAMLDRARRHEGIDWVLAPAAAATWRSEFDLTVMTGHAFQSLLTDDDLRASLAAIRAALRPGATFAFETRNPAVREWEQWAAGEPMRVGDLAVSYQVEPVVGDVVRLSETFQSPRWAQPHVDRGALRFLDRDSLGSVLTEAGFAVEQQFGTWDRRPVEDTSAEIITLATAR